MSRLSVPDAFGLASVSRGFLAELHRLQKSGELVKSKRTAELIARGASPAAANKFEYVTRRNRPPARTVAKLHGAVLPPPPGPSS